MGKAHVAQEGESQCISHLKVLNPDDDLVTIRLLGTFYSPPAFTTSLRGHAAALSCSAQTGNQNFAGIYISGGGLGVGVQRRRRTSLGVNVVHVVLHKRGCGDREPILTF